jgi:hypothetical protein
MNSIFVVGIFTDRNRAFFELLCENFRVFAFKSHTRCFSGLNFSFAEDVVGEVPFPYADFAWELRETADETERLLAQLLAGDEKTSELSQDEFSELHNIAFNVYSSALLFSHLADKVKIDIVVVNADYSASRRPVVIEAKGRGIPVLDIEHGFFAMQPEPSVLNEDFLPVTANISDYVNLDNVLEVDIWQQYYALTELKSATHFIANGTPNDISYNPNLSREDALATLGLAPGKFILTLVGSWIEARIPSYLFNAQIEQVEFYKFVFQSLRDYPRKDNLQLVVKLHPAFGHQQVMNDVRGYLQNIAEQCGLKDVLIKLDHLSEILSASDLIICTSRTSVLWESFLASVPALIYPAQSVVKRVFKPGQMNQSNTLFRSGVMQYITEPAELRERIDHYSLTENKQAYRELAQDVCDKFEIKPLTAAEKSQNLCKWIREYLENRD